LLFYLGFDPTQGDGGRIKVAIGVNPMIKIPGADLMTLAIGTGFT
jgi:hypothetical protein